MWRMQTLPQLHQENNRMQTKHNRQIQKRRRTNKLPTMETKNMKQCPDIKIIQEEINNIYFILKELEPLETGEEADYSGIIQEITWNRVMLNNRLTTLKEKQI